MRKKKDNIEYFELSEKELKIYKGCAFRSLRIRLIFFCLLIPIYIIYCIELFGKFSIPFIRCTAVFIGFFIGPAAAFDIVVVFIIFFDNIF